MIFEILNIFTEICSFYNNSTLPKFIKKIICQSRVRKLIKSAKKVKNFPYYTWSDLYMVFQYVESNKQEYDETDDYLQYAFNIVEDDGSVDNLNITFYPNMESMDLNCVIRMGDNTIRSVTRIKDTDISQATSDIIAIALNDINDIMRNYMDQMMDIFKIIEERLYKS